MHNREYTVFLRPHEGGLMLHTMYYAEEVRQVEGFGAPEVELKDAEVKVAHQLIEALAAEWDPEKYHDTFQENVKKLIETKLEGGKITEVEKPKKLAPVVDLMAALKQSLAEMEGKKKPAAPAREAGRQAVKRQGVERRQLAIGNWQFATSAFRRAEHSCAASRYARQFLFSNSPGQFLKAAFRLSSGHQTAKAGTKLPLADCQRLSLLADIPTNH